MTLDARGNVLEGETGSFGGEGAEDVKPKISHAGDGGFLICGLWQSPQSIMVARGESEGGVTSTETTFDGGLFDPLSPPVRLGDNVYVLAAISTGYPGEVALFQYAYPDLTFRTAARMISFDQMGIAPTLMKMPDESMLMVNSRHLEGEYVAVEHVYLSLAFSGAITTFGGDRHTNPVGGLHASSSSLQWYAYGFTWKADELTSQFFKFDPDLDYLPPWRDPVIPAEAFNERMDSDTTDYPATGAVFTLYSDGMWNIWAYVSTGTGLSAESDMFIVGTDESSDLERPPNPTIAWTGEGFLVVWDEYGDGESPELSSSYIAID